MTYEKSPSDLMSALGCSKRRSAGRLCALRRWASLPSSRPETELTSSSSAPDSPRCGRSPTRGDPLVPLRLHLPAGVTLAKDIPAVLLGRRPFLALPYCLLLDLPASSSSHPPLYCPPKSWPCLSLPVTDPLLRSSYSVTPTLHPFSPLSLALKPNNPSSRAPAVD